VEINYTKNISESAALTLPYSADEMRQLDVSLVHWMRSLNIFRKLGIREEVFSTGKVDSMGEIEREIKQGVLLCDLVSLVFNVKINGVFREPRTDNTCLANIRKGLEVLRR
jgi:hypothetical protein